MAFDNLAPNPFSIMQQMKAGNNFDGSAPEDSTVPLVVAWSENVFKFAPGDKGGLFDLDDIAYKGNEQGPFALVGIELSLSGDQTSWTLSRIDVFSNELLIYAGTTETSFVATWENNVILLNGENLKLVTVGSPTNAMIATMKFAPPWPVKGY